METRTYILSEQNWQNMSPKSIRSIDLFARKNKLRSMQIF